MVPKTQIGIVADNANRRVSIFDINSLQTLQQILLNVDVVDVAIAPHSRRAVVTTSVAKTFYQLDLSEIPARIVGSAVAPTTLLDIAITPDEQFALSVDGAGNDRNIISYSLRKNAIVSSLPTNAQSVAISPLTRELVLTTVYNRNAVRRFTIDCRGLLSDTGEETPAGPFPGNSVFTTDGQFNFVADYENGISVLSTLIPDHVTLLGAAASSGQPQSMAVTGDGRHLFVLGPQFVDIYAFDAVAGNLALLRSFAHGLQISSFFGVDQIALDPSETRLFISAVGQVAVFTTYGLPLGSVDGSGGPGGIAIGKTEYAPADCED